MKQLSHKLGNNIVYYYGKLVFQITMKEELIFNGMVMLKWEMIIVRLHMIQHIHTVVHLSP